jgi:2'-5' RNA ligase
MAYAISLWFEKDGEDSIRAIWKELHDQGQTSFLWEGAFRPHVTLAIYEELNIDAFKSSLLHLTSKTAPFEITLPSVGLFSSPPGELSVSGNAIFLSVTPTKALLDFHFQIHQLLSEYGKNPRPYYLPNRWNPHSTLARNISSKSIPIIVDTCQYVPLPIRPIVDRIGIIDTPAEVELECVSLTGK